MPRTVEELLKEIRKGHPSEPRTFEERYRMGGKFGIETTESREERARKEKVRKVKNTLAIRQAAEKTGDRFDPSGSLDDPGLRFDLGQSTNLFERRGKFFAKYPQGDYQPVDLPDGSKTEIFKINDKEPYREVFGPGFVGKVADISSAVINPTVVGEVIGSTPIGRGTGAAIKGARIARRVIGGAIGAGGGELVGQEIESLRGFQTDPTLTRVGQAGIATGLGAAGGVLALPLSYARNMSGGVLPIPIIPEAPLIIGSFRRLGVQEPVYGQLAKYRIMRESYTQALQTAGKDPRSAQFQGLLDAIESRTNLQRFEAMGEGKLQALVNSQTNELYRMIKDTSPDLPESGGALQAGVELYKTTSGVQRDRFYKAAFDTDNGKAIYDIQTVKELNYKRLYGVHAKGLPTQGEAGRMQPGGPIRVAGIENKQLLDVMNKIKDIDPKMQTIWTIPRPGANDPSSVMIVPKGTKGATRSTAYDQIKSVRTSLFELKRDRDGHTRQVATELWKALTDAMDNPVSSNKKFLDLHKRASTFNKAREDNLSLVFIRSVLNSDEPANLVERFFRPGRSGALDVFQKVMPKKEFDSFKGFYLTKLTNDPGSIVAKIDDFAARDPKGLDVLLSKREQANLRKYGKLWEKFEKGKLSGLVSSGFSPEERAAALLKSGEYGELGDLVKRSGGPSGKFAFALKAGIFREMLSKSYRIETPSGKSIASPTETLKYIESLKSRPELRTFMTDDDWKVIKDFSNVSAALSAVEGVGGELQSASTRGLLQKWYNPVALGRAFVRVFGAASTARMLSIPASRALIITASKNKNLSFEDITRVGVAASLIVYSKYSNRPQADFATDEELETTR